MSLNIFEGARRLAVLVGGVASLIVLSIWYNSETYVSVNYSIRQPGLPFYRTDGETCPEKGVVLYINTKTNKDQKVHVNLCLLPMKFKDGDELIPYKVDASGMVWGARTFSTEVEEYRKKLEKTFKIPDEHQSEISELVNKTKRKDFTDTVGGLGIGLAIFVVLVSVIGWIVRGFMGIPNGMDHRP